MEYVVVVLGALFVMFGGIGIVLIMFSSSLSSSNDTGRNTYDLKDYNAKIEFGMCASAGMTSDPEGWLKIRAKSYKRLYAPDPKETVHVLSPEELESIRVTSDKAHVDIPDQYDLDGDLPSVDKPLFKPKD